MLSGILTTIRVCLIKKMIPVHFFLGSNNFFFALYLPVKPGEDVKSVRMW